MRAMGESSSVGCEGGEVETLGLRPGEVLRGELRPPGSKSLAIRTLLTAALAQGRTVVRGAPDSEDVAACLDVLDVLGLSIARDGKEVEIDGRSPAAGATWEPAGPLACGESGTLARMLTAAAAFCSRPGSPVRVEVCGSLLRRSSAPLLETLDAAGVGLEAESEAGSWPLVLRPSAAPETLLLQSPVSSQELSGLLLAQAAQPVSPRGRSVIVMGGLPSEPYAHLTAGVLTAFGARVEAVGAEWRVSGPLVAPAEPLEIEADASGAAVALAAGCLSGGEVSVAGFPTSSRQGDLAIVELLEAFGCRAERRGDELVAGGRPTRSAELDLAATPDLAPVLAAVAGAAALAGIEGRSVLRGLETLNGKESRRVEVLAGGLAALGLDVRASDEHLEVEPGAGAASAGQLVLDPQGDHRMAFAFALLGLVRPGLAVSNPGCVAKSWPGFWEELRRARQRA